jgi:hypothetical protein
VLRHQLIVVQRKMRGRVQLTNGDRLFLVQLYRWFLSVLRAIMIFRPETLVRWHRSGFRRYWQRKSRSLGGRPRVAADLRALIQRMSAENPLWERRASMASCSDSASRSLSRASRSTWSSARPLRDGAPSCNHAPDIAAMDLFVAPHWLRPALCLHHRPAGPPRSRLDQRHNKSERGLDRTPDHGGIPLE